MKIRFNTLFLPLAFAFAMVACTGCTGNEPDTPDTPEVPDVPDPKPEPEPVNYTEVQMRRDIAQMIITAFDGATIDYTKNIYNNIKNYNVGGVILFEYRNNIESPEQLTKLCSSLQAIAGDSLFISIDQEGGRIARLNPSHGFPEFPSARDLGAADDATTKYWAELTASTCANVGINVNFAPVVDVDVNPNSPGLGKIGRTFSADANVVARKAGIWVDAHTKNGVIACAKHFPGHGSASTDSHKGLTDVTNTWTDMELTPYRSLIDEGKIDLIMVGHLFNSNIDSESPTSLSKKAIDGLLRTTLGYNGVVITDDLGMGAVKNYYAYDEIIKRAVNAGADLLCLTGTNTVEGQDIVPYTIDLLVEAVKAGQVSADRIRQSAARISALKHKYIVKK